MNEPRREASEQQLPDALRAWGFDSDIFRARAKQSIESARGDLSEVIGVLRQTIANTKTILIDLQKSAEPATTELKKGFERAWSEIEQAVARPKQTPRDSQTAERRNGDDSNWLG